MELTIIDRLNATCGEAFRNVINSRLCRKL